jgi:hypothetical protein
MELPENLCKVILLPLLALFLACSPYPQNRAQNSQNYIGVSKTNSSYFQFADGTPYVPVGINMINPSGYYGDDPDSSLYEIGQWMKNLSENGGNYVRIWLSESFWDIEDQQAGIFSEEKAKRIDRFIEMARLHHLRIKITLEHFRSLTLEENPQEWATKFVYHTSHGGPLDSIRQYLTSPAGRKLFTDKLDYYKKRYGSDTLFFGWELWNEMNAMHGPIDSVFFNWNRTMLGEVKQRFPENLVMQSLGSFDADAVRPVYKMMMLLKGNEVAQIHRYLDPGAEMDVCRMPMDMICSSAIWELRSYNTGKPLLLAETGAVEASHSGPSKLYPKDTAGILLHDILFAPYFSGAAGSGMSWHWESYVDRNHLWHHFGRFCEAIRNTNPIVEAFVPSRSETDDLRMYLLTGKKTTLIWIRDKMNTWESELEEKQPPRILHDLHINLLQLGIAEAQGPVTVYDPWKNAWSTAVTAGETLVLPDFKRSLVIRVTRK